MPDLLRLIFNEQTPILLKISFVATLLNFICATINIILTIRIKKIDKELKKFKNRQMNFYTAGRGGN